MVSDISKRSLFWWKKSQLTSKTKRLRARKTWPLVTRIIIDLVAVWFQISGETAFAASWVLLFDLIEWLADRGVNGGVEGSGTNVGRANTDARFIAAPRIITAFCSRELSHSFKSLDSEVLSLVLVPTS